MAIEWTRFGRETSDRAREDMMEVEDASMSSRADVVHRGIAVVVVVASPIPSLYHSNGGVSNAIAGSSPWWW